MSFGYGLHGGPGGNHNGIGGYWQALDAAGVPFFFKSTDAYKLEAANIAASSAVPHTVIFRLTTAGQNDGIQYDVPNYAALPQVAAHDHWQHIKAKLPPGFDKVVWVEVVNEVDKNKAGWIGNFMTEIAAIANSQGYKVAGPGWASGEPEPAHWITTGMLRYLRYCADNPGKAAVSVHEYDYEMMGFSDPSVLGWHIGRFHDILNACDLNGIAYPEIHITEFGWSLNDIPSLADCLSELDWAYRYVYGPYRQWVKGAAIWCLQAYQGDIHNKVQRLIVPVTDYMLNLPDVPTEPDPTPNPIPPAGNVLINGSFEDGWTDIPGGQQPNGWTVQFTAGPNPVDPNWPYVMPEFQVKPRSQFPPDEQDLFVRHGEYCYKVFKGSGTWNARLVQVLDVADGRYLLSLPIFGDFVTGYTPSGGKIFAAYDSANPAGQLRINGGNWILMRPGVYEVYEFELDVQRGDALTIEMRGNFPLPQNGIFADAWEMTMLEQPTPAETLEEFIWRSSLEIAPTNNDAALQRAITGDVYDGTRYLPYGREEWRTYAGDGAKYAIQPAIMWSDPIRRRAYYCKVPEWSNVKILEDPTNFTFTHWPTEYKTVTQVFGANPEYYGQWGLPGHEGVDIRGPLGSRIFAVASGQVSNLNQSPTGHNYGRFIRVKHGKYETTYAHLDSIQSGLAIGTAVNGGQLLGTADSTGNSTGSHLHLTLKHDDAAPGGSHYIGYPHNIIDPMPFVMPFNPAMPPPVPSPTAVDMSQFFLPPNNATHGDILILKNNWGAGDERVQLQREGDLSYVVKNQQWERRRVTADKIFLELDTSPGEGLYYTVESPTGWMPRHWLPGQTFVRQETTRFYRKADCQPTGAVSNWSTSLVFKQVHSTWTSQAGITLANVAELHWIVNGVIDEWYWFGEGLGLVAWQKYDGRKSWVNELIPHGTQGDNVRETGCFSL